MSWAGLDDGDVLTEARSILITVRVGNELLAFLARGAPRPKMAVLAGLVVFRPLDARGGGVLAPGAMVRQH